MLLHIQNLSSALTHQGLCGQPCRYLCAANNLRPWSLNPQQACQLHVYLQNSMCVVISTPFIMLFYVFSLLIFAIYNIIIQSDKSRHFVRVYQLRDVK